MSELNRPLYAPGLAGIAAAKTRKSRIDGERGELLVCGYRVEDFAERANFEEIIFLQPERVLQTNVEYYTALVLHGLGLPSELFTPVFACGRAAGWAAHALEQRLHRAERSLRPDAIYEGAVDLEWAE